MKIIFGFIVALFAITTVVKAQPVPGIDENIPFLMTFSNKTATSWGDDNGVQIIFFTVPVEHTQPIYIRVFDPDCGGTHDEQNGNWDSKTRFSVYGGNGACSNKDAQHCNTNGDYDSGTQLAQKIFATDAQYDNKWYTFGPFNPSEGELLPEFGGRIFKVMVEGLTGDDGNMYRFFMSSKQNDNAPVEGGFAFYFKYKFRLYDTADQVSHIYPFIDKTVISIKQSNFDWDSDGLIRVVSCSKNGIPVKVSGDDNWATSALKIDEDERGTSWDIQMIKSKAKPLKNNNVVFYLENQYGELLPFYSVPIGGVPKYKYNITAKQSNKQSGNSPAPAMKKK